MRPRTPGNIIQDIPIRVEVILTARIETPPGADTQKILEALGPEVLLRIKAIKFVSAVNAIHVEEVRPMMVSERSH